MKTTYGPSKKRQISALLFIILSGVLGAVLLTWATTIYYTTEATYRATNVILDPKLLSTIKYIEHNARGDKTSYVYDRITYRRPGTKEINLTEKQYEGIYALLSGDRSLPEDTDLASKFDDRSAVLAIVLKNDTLKSFYTLMRMEFAATGNYYRVELRGNGSKELWAYFSHPDVLSQVMQIAEK